MYLKSLQMVGFKSFADKTRLEFHPGVTAIVGPNGCGKSNVLDAFRWVLGEQSAKALRGSEMSDVIFNGADSRKPTSMAEVLLTFADCEKDLNLPYNEITIGRRIFRDGRSEYELNRTTCRLRDIQELFMGTGIGRAAYSIMEQGKIDKVLSAHPEDRREIFEEAAGITKFKAQRKEALRKLENTEGNLIRIEDILKEVKRQIGSLQRQAGKARRFREIQEQLRVLEFRLAHREGGLLKEAVEKLEKQMAAQAEELANLNASIQVEELKLSDLRTQSDDLEKEAERLRQLRAELTTTIDRARSRVDFNLERISDTEKADQAARLDQAASEERLKVLADQIASVELALAHNQEESSRHNGQLQAAQTEAAEARQRANTLQREANDLQRSLRQTDDELQRLNSDLSSWDAEKRAFALRLEASQQDLGSARATHGAFEAELHNLSTETTAARAAREQSRTSLESYSLQLREANTARDTARKSREAAEKRRVEISSKRDVLVKLQKSHEGFSSGTQKVLKMRDAGAFGDTKLKDTLADAIKVQSGFEAAVDMLLGYKLEAFLVDDIASARQVLATLNIAETGRVSLLPSTTAPASQPFPELPSSALSKISTTPDCAEAVRHVLAGCYIVDNADAALELRAQVAGSTVASLDGVCITAEGIFTAGQRSPITAALTRKQEIDELEQQLLAIQSDCEQALAAEGQADQQVSSAQQALESTRHAVREAEERATSAAAREEAHRRQLQDALRRIETLEKEISRIEETSRASDERHSRQVQRRDELAAQRTTSLARSDELQQLLSAENQNDQQRTTVITELRIAAAALEEKMSGSRSQLTSLGSRKHELEQTATKRAKELADNAARRAQLLTENDALLAEAKVSEEKLILHGDELDKVQANRAAVHAETEALDLQLRGVRSKQHDLGVLKNRIEVDMAKKRMELAHLADRMHRTYQMNLDQVGEEVLKFTLAPTPNVTPTAEGEGDPASPQSEPTTQEQPPFPVEPDWDGLAVTASELRSKMEAMGPVNLESIAEFDELDARHKFIETQHSDLLSSKQNLLEAINKINETSKQMFAETFAKVRENFIQTFTKLFGGGKASIDLTDETDPLECGIEIIAKPPGKHPQRITLLSGGERTMTAVALLFAIYMVKPSPFCILDEMDAPLDESNIGRFLEMLGGFLDLSQFLLITHSKKTIAFADALYGVTMEERGVSKTISMRFNSAARQPRASNAPPPALDAAQSGEPDPATTAPSLELEAAPETPEALPLDTVESADQPTGTDTPSAENPQAPTDQP